MATFTDRHQRTWTVVVLTTDLRRVREATGFELSKVLDDNFSRLQQLDADPELLCRVLFVLVADQAKAIPLTEEQFTRGVSGDATEAAFDALVQALADFFPSHRRKLLLTVAEKRKECIAEATRVIATLSDSPSDSAGSPGSTPPG